jgi:signal transduction histidine kinase
VVSIVRRAWGWIESHPLGADTALAAALLSAALVSSDVTLDLFKDDPSFEPPDKTAVAAGLVAMVAPLALRRRAPLTVLLATTAAFLALSQLVGPELEATITAIGISLAFYSAAAHSRSRWRNWVGGICVVAVLGQTVLELNAIGPDLPVLFQVFAALTNFALFGAMWALGAALGSGRRRAKELLERTVELEHEREENARRAVFDERVRIARELHDVVAHHVSMMGVQAGAARVVIGRDPVKAKEALAAIERSSREAVLELHRLLGFLRQAGDPDDLGPQPGLAQLASLAATMSDSELTVEISVQGGQRPLPPTVDVSAYRIVQEALTNVLKHSGASRADVHLRYWPGELELEIVDDGRGNGSRSTAPGGLGLIGMRERAVLHGGQLSAGAAVGGGFAVRAKLPAPDGAL